MSSSDCASLPETVIGGFGRRWNRQIFFREFTTGVLRCNKRSPSYGA
jgi:hypothetical protein